MYCGLQTSRRLFGSGGPKGQAVPETDGIPCSSRLPARARNASGSPVLQNNSHKGIIIGKGGAMLKKVSTLARQDMERFMGTKVKVKENWRDNPSAIQNFGYRKE